MRHGEIGFVQPFRYTLLVWAMLFGHRACSASGRTPGCWPAARSWSATGLFTLHRERRLGLDACAVALTRLVGWARGDGAPQREESRCGIACIGECMVELTLPREDGGAAAGSASPATRSTPPSTSSARRRRSRSPMSPRSAPIRCRRGCSPSSRPRGSTPGLVERRADRVPGLYAISLDAAGERSFTYWRDSSAARTLFLPPAEVTPERLDGLRSHLSLGDHPGGPGAGGAGGARGLPGAAIARAAGRVAFDSNYRPRLWPDVATARREIGAFWAADRHRPALARRRDGALRRGGRGGGAGAARSGRGARAGR